MKILILAFLIFSACEAQIPPTSNFGRTGNKGTIQQSPLINLDTYFDVLNLQSNTWDNFTVNNPNHISRWTDLSSNANHAVQATAANQPVFDLVNGLKYDGVVSKLVTGSEITLSNGTIFLVFKNLTDGSNNPLLAAAATGDRIYLATSNNGIVKISVNGGTEQGVYQLGADGFRKIVMIRKNGTVWDLKFNDRVMTTGQAGTSLANGAIKINGIGFSTSSNLFYDSYLSAVMVSSSVIDDVTANKIVTTLMARYNVAGASEVSIIGFGDSLTQNETSYPILPDLATTMGIPKINCGMTGTKASNVTSSANNGQDRVATTVPSRPYKDKVYILFGANDIGDAGISSTDFQNALDAIVASLLTAGYATTDLCVCSPPYRTNYFLTTQARTDAFRTAAHAVAVNRHIHYADVLQPLLDTGVPDTYMVDSLHPTAAGAALIATAIYNGFQAATL